MSYLYDDKEKKALFPAYQSKLDTNDKNHMCHVWDHLKEINISSGKEDVDFLWRI